MGASKLNDRLSTHRITIYRNQIKKLSFCNQKMHATNSLRLTVIYITIKILIDRLEGIVIFKSLASASSSGPSSQRIPLNTTKKRRQKQEGRRQLN